MSKAKQEPLTIATGSKWGDYTLSCEASLRASYRYRECGKDAAWVLVDDKRRQPLCGLHKAAYERGYRYGREVELAIPADAVRQMARKNARRLQDQIEARQREAEAAKRHEAFVARRSQEVLRPVEVVRRDDFEYRRGGEAGYQIVPRWYVGNPGDRDWDKVKVQFRWDEAGILQIDVTGMHTVDVSIARGMIEALTAATALADGYTPEYTNEKPEGAEE